MKMTISEKIKLNNSVFKVKQDDATAFLKKLLNKKGKFPFTYTYRAWDEMYTIRNAGTSRVIGYYDIASETISFCL